jgi:hypothetical protein
MRKVEVTWRDSHRYTYQMHPDEKIETATIGTIGYLVRQDKHMIVLAQDDIMGDVRGVIAIPLENVTKIKTLR